jgi:hypothetical protein
LKPVDHSILAFIFFGIVHRTYRWYNPKAKRAIGPNQLRIIFSEVFLRGTLAQNALNKAMQILAGLGRFEEHFLPGYLGDAIAIWLLEETGQIQRNTAAT